jgi:heat shock protein HslJ
MVALQGTTWKLAEIAGTPVIEGSAATLEFTEAGKVSGNGSCNRFFGGATIEGQTITIGPQGTTRMACAEAIAAQENRYLKALGQAERFEQAGEALVIHCKGMDTPLRFVRQ